MIGREPMGVTAKLYVVLPALEATLIKTSNSIVCKQKEFVYNLKVLHVSTEL